MTIRRYDTVLFSMVPTSSHEIQQAFYFIVLSNPIDLENTAKRIFSFESRLRYNRERVCRMITTY